MATVIHYPLDICWSNDDPKYPGVYSATTITGPTGAPALLGTCFSCNRVGVDYLDETLAVLTLVVDIQGGTVTTTDDTIRLTFPRIPWS